LIPGIGYGRNAKIFSDNGFKITGIEISETAINLAREVNGLNIKIHKGSVTEMPYDKNIFDGVFCYALIHLLNKQERKRFLESCYNQLKPNGYLMFAVVSKNADMFGKGKLLSKDRYKLMTGLNVFFYDSESIEKEFKNFGLLDYQEIDEPIKHLKNVPPLKLYLIRCKKN
jgi:SAM-dependent methyltransferase